MAALLSEVAVLDLSIWRPGPYATSLLTYLGADVLKVEPPGGDPMRHYPELFESVNAGKRSVVLDLKDPGDRAVALGLAAEADVVVEGFRPGVMARLGLDEATVRQVNPAVIYCSISGYGQLDQRAQLPGHDINYQAWAGSLSPEGGTATMPPLPAADLASGLAAAFGICAALAGRPRPGEGIYLDVSMTDVMATWTGSAHATTATTNPTNPTNPTPTTSGDHAVAGYGLFATSDRSQVALGVVNEQHFWTALCQVIGLDEAAGLNFEQRSRRGKVLNAELAAAIARQPRGELVTALLAAGVPVAPVLDRAGMVTSAPFPPFPIRLPAAAASHAPPAPHAPTLDQHRGEGFRRTHAHTRTDARPAP